jgi:DNA ligase D-like protein (predicted polymerase)
VSSTGEAVELEIGGNRLRVSSPERVYFPAVGITKWELIDYYLRVADLLMPHCRGRPCNLERYPQGVDGPSFVQKRVPPGRPDWLSTTMITFGSGRTAEELCPQRIGDVAWAVTQGALTVHPWPLRVLPPAAVGGPDELRVDLDPMPGVEWATTMRVTRLIGELLDEHGLTGYPKTSGASGMHVIARIEPRSFLEVRAAAVALAREAERRMPTAVTASWWKEERGSRVFVDYNQNLWDRSMACAYAVRATPDARVSLPVSWGELDSVDPADATVRSIDGLLAGRRDPMGMLDDTPGSIDGLLERAARDAANGLSDLPLPPHFPKTPTEPRRVPPSRARSD